MKLRLFKPSAVWAFGALANCITQVSGAPAPSSGHDAASAVVSSSPGGWKTTIKDWHSTLWERTIVETNSASGELVTRTSSFTEVGGGLNYVGSSGAWQRSEDSILVSTNAGGADAAFGPTKVHFSPTLGLDGATLQITTASNTIFFVEPLAVYFVDGSGAAVLLANLRPGAEGELIPPNRVVYHSVTTNGLGCDIMYTYTHGAFESDLVIRTQPSVTPESVGLDPASTRLSLVHLVSGALPHYRAGLNSAGLMDAQLSFPGLHFPEGFAFRFGAETNVPPGSNFPVNTPGGNSSPERIPVAKRVIPIRGLQWALAEDVMWEDVKQLLEDLPPYTQGASLSRPMKHASLILPVEPVRSAQRPSRSKPMKVASASYRPRGVDLDFITVVTGNSFDFDSGQTYYLSSSASFSGTVSFFGSCVIKEASGVSLTLNGPVNCYGTAYNPSIITALNDWAFGENALPGSTGYPAVAGNPALHLAVPNSLTGFKFRWAQTALQVDGTGSVGLTNSSVEWSTTGVVANGVTLALSGCGQCTVTTLTGGTGTVTGSFTNACSGTDPSNGLPLSWEYEYFGQGGINASADPDGDGLSNSAEYSNGTNPQVYDRPQIQTQPQGQTVVMGTGATLSVGATGTGTLAYQWYRAGIPISGATASSYTISSAQYTNSCTYFVVVTNLYGIVSSSPAFLSVAVPTTGSPLPNGILDWWSGNNNANDSIGTNNGIFSGSYITAEVGQGFNVLNSATAVRIPAAPTLNVGTNNGFTIEGWINPYDTVGRPVIEWAPTNSYGVHVWVNFGAAGSVWFNLADTAGNTHLFQSSGSLITPNVLQHLAVTYDKIAGNLQVFVNGTLKTNYSIGTVAPQTGADLWLGCRPSTVNGTSANFNGVIDEMSLYNRVLGSGEIATIYNAGANGKILGTAPTITGTTGPGSIFTQGGTTNFTVTASGTTPFTYQWMFNGNAIAGATTSSYTVVNAQMSNQGNYSVVVANVEGSALSRNLGLTVYNGCAALQSGILDWWRGEQNANDQVGTNNGQWMGTAAYTSGWANQGFSFPGTSGNYVQIPNSGSLQLTNAFTIEFWCKDTGLGSGAYGGLIAKRPASGACNFGVTLMGGTPKDNLYVYLLDPGYNGGLFQLMTCLNAFPNDGAFHHIAVTYNQVTTNRVDVQAYVDGTFISVLSLTASLPNTLNSSPVTLGSSTSTLEWFHGVLDEISIYSGVLSTVQIQTIAYTGSQGKCYDPPLIIVQPQSQTVLQGTTPLLSVGAAGDFPFSTQWYLNGTLVPGAGASAYGFGYWITNIQPSQAGDYFAVVSNIVGKATSSIATISVVSPPSIVVPPAPQASPMGGNVTFTVTAGGTPPFTYQWNQDGIPIVGAVNSTYNIANVQLNNYGNYSVTVGNAYGSVTSTNAPLSYSPPCTPAPSGLVAWWPGEGACSDIIGTNNGIFSGVYTNGEVNQGFTVTSSSTAVRVPASSSLNVGAGGGFTIEGWIKAYDTTPRSIFEWAPTNTYGVHIWANYSSVGAVYANIVDIGNVSHILQSAPGLFGTGAFVHVALSFDKTSGTANLFVNGVKAVTNTFTGITPQTSPDLWLGCRPSSVGGVTTPFNGVIDEVSIYNRALSASEIGSIYNATASGKCTSEPANSMFLTITSPTNSQPFTEQATVPLQAKLFDNAGTNGVVKFYYDTNLIGTATQASTNGLYYNLTWVTNWGTYAVTAVAVDNVGVSNVSYPRIITVKPTNNFPVVSITYPTQNAVFTEGTDLTITANATNIAGSAPVTNVVFFVNDVPLGSDSLAPYSITKCCWSAGTYQLTALAADAKGMVGATTNTVTIAVGGSTERSVNGFWDPLFGNPGVGNTLTGSSVSAMAVFGNNLYVAGWSLGGINNLPSFNSAAKWDGTSWTSLDGTNDGGSSYYSPQAHQFAFDGTNLYLAGEYYSGQARAIAKYDGANWSSIDSNSLSGTSARAILIMGSDIYAGGDFSRATPPLNNVIHLNPTNWNWESVGPTLNGPVYALAQLGGHLYAGGTFTGAGSNTNANGIAELVGNTWTNLGSGVGGTTSQGVYGGVYALSACGSNLFVGGEFSYAGGNTNANGIAKWDGIKWTTIGNGLWGGDVDSNVFADFSSINSTNQFPAKLRVSSIIAQGNTLYVGGEFRRALQGTNLVVNHIAKAVWAESSQSWTWSDLDQGLVSTTTDDFVLAMALMPGSSPGQYDLFAGGSFNIAGSTGTGSHDIAKWSVGRPLPNNAPTVAITAPADGTSFTNPSSPVLIQATATASGGATPSSVQFYVDGSTANLQNNGLVNSTTGPWQVQWNSLPGGGHVITAVVKDSNSPSEGAASKPVVVRVYYTSNNVSALNDYFTVLANSGPNYLPVLTNDVPSTGLKISSVGEGLFGNYGNPTLGAVGVSFDRQSVVFTPTPNTFGSNILSYWATNSSGGSNEAFVTVRVAAAPFVAITNPSAALVFTNTASLTISGSTVDFDGTVTGIQILTNDVPYGSTLTPSGGSFSTTWTQTNPGFYTFRAVATDNDNNSVTSTPVTVQIMFVATNAHSPIASISSPVQPWSFVNKYVLSNAFMVRDARLALAGNAYSPDAGASVNWQIVLADPQNPTNVLYNATPGTLNAQGFATGAIVSTYFSTNLDLSLVQNGTYLLSLVVQSEGLQTNANLLIQVESGAKIGQFTFSEQDLVVPVAGIPLTITRTYNSINPLSSDFGYSWTFALNEMDVQLDEQRTPVVIGSADAPYAEQENDANGAPLMTSIRTGGNRDVTLTLPDGRRTTFYFKPYVGQASATALWSSSPGVYATLSADPPSAANIVYPPVLNWGGYSEEPFDAHDVPGWVLQTQDGTQYYITRGGPNIVAYNFGGLFQYPYVTVYGPPKLTRIVQPSGDTIVIGTNSIYHKNKGGLQTHTVWFDRDGLNRITAIHDPTGGSSGTPVVQYVYNNDTGNLIQVLKLTDRNAGIYTTNQYHYDLPQFPHYITEIDNGNGVPITRNYYDTTGRLIATVDPNGYTNQFIHDLTNNIEKVIDRRGATTSYAYDTRGNVTAMTNALGGITLSTYDTNNNKLSQVAFNNGTQYATNTFGYDPNGLLLATTNALGFTNGFGYNSLGEVTNSIDARGFGATNFYDPTSGLLLGTVDALRNTTTNFYDANGLLLASRDAVNTFTTNWYDAFGNVTSTCVYVTSPSLTILSTNTSGYDLDGNRTNSTTWRQVAGVWTPSRTTYIYDGQNRVIQTINPDGGTNSVIFDAAGRQIVSLDPLGHGTTNSYDFLGRLILTTFADGTTNSSSYDANGNRIASVDQAGNQTQYGYDALNRLTTTTFADTKTTSTVYDDLGRVRFSIDSRGTTNAFGYDAAGKRTTVTNAWGFTGIQITNGFVFDPNGNQTASYDGAGNQTSYTFDALNRQIQVQYADTTKTFTGYDAAGRKVAETNQDSIVTFFGYDGVGRLVVVTNAFNTAQQIKTQYQYDEAGNETAQTDASSRTTTFGYDSMGRRTSRVLPAGQSESFGYDRAGNLLSHTDFNSLTLTNAYDPMNRLQVRNNAGTPLESYGYSLGKMTSRTDLSGSFSWTYNSRNRLSQNVTPAGTLNYTYDANGNLATLASASSSGVSLTYSYDPLNRLTNVVDTRLSSPNNTAYSYDPAGNLKAMAYPNGITNRYTYDTLNRLTRIGWTNKNTGGQVGDFSYTLKSGGARTGLAETVSGTSRTFTWNYDNLYRLSSDAVSASPAGSLGYVYDSVGNRTSRTGTLGNLSPQTTSFDVNDEVDNDTTASTHSTWFDSNGNNISFGGAYTYDYANRLVTQASPSVTITCDADGNRVKKVTSSGTTWYLVAMVNPTGYPQVVEEWSGPTPSTLTRVYSYGLSLLSQRQLSGSVVTFYGTDGLGSVRFLADTSATIQNTYAYDAFGTAIYSNAAVANTRLFAGEEFDPDLKLSYNRARYYDPGTGRFFTMDTDEGKNEDPLSLHKYLYCYSNPLNQTDPTGYSAASEVGTQVHSFLARKWESKDGRFGPGLGGLRWGNRQVRTILKDMVGTGWLPVWPYTIRPDLAEIDVLQPLRTPASKGRLFEIKPGILSMAESPDLLQVALRDAATQLSGYFVLNASTHWIWERGGLATPNVFQSWPDFPAPIGTSLVTLDVSKTVPGLVIYEFLPTREALEYVALGSAVGAGAAAAERYGVSAAIKIAVRGLIQTGARASAAYLENGIKTDVSAAALGY
jgi:RHS repeat-associated protein